MSSMSPFSRFSRYFVEIVRQGSLRKAAEQLHISASAINRQLLQAEEDLQTTLFERLPQGLKLTASGELLYAEIQRWQKDFARTRRAIDDLDGLRRGHVRIAMIDAVAESSLLNAIALLRHDYPNLHFSINVQKNSQVIDSVTKLDADIGLLLSPSECADLELRAALSVPVGIVMPAEHPLARQREITASATLDYRRVMPASPLIIHEMAQRIYPGMLVEGTVIDCNDIRTIRTLVLGGAGIGFLSWLDAEDDIKKGRLAFVPLSARHVAPMTLGLCVAPHRQLSKAVQLVLDHLVKAMHGLASELEDGGTNGKPG